MLYSGYESSKSGYPNRSTFNSSTYNSYDDYSYNQTSSSPVCTNIDVLLDQVNKDPTLVRLFEKRRTNVAELAQLNASISALKANYDTKLLEKIAGSDPNNTPNPGTADTTKTNIDLLISQRTAIELQITSNRQSIIQNEFIKRIVMLAKGEGQDVLRKYSYLSSIYPIKVFGVQVLFLLPLLLIIGFWSNRSLKR